MALLDQLFEARASKSVSLPPKDPALVDLFGFGRRTAAGQSVTTESALGIPAVYAAVQVLTGTIASLPLITYQREADGRGKRRAQRHPLFRLLKEQPNRWQTAMEFREMLQGHLLLRGNGYAEKATNGRGEVEELIPLHPDRVRPFQPKRGTIAWAHTPQDGGERVLLPGEVLHIRGLSSDGVSGFSPIKLARETLGAQMGADEYAARFFSNDATPGGVLEHPETLSDEAFQRLRESWAERHQGAGRSHKPAILEEGMSWKSIGITPEDAQLVESRKWGVNEIARIFNLPPHKLRDLERATFSNIEQQQIDFVVGSVQPWLVRWEQALARDLLTDRDRQRGVFVEHIVEGMLRGDTQMRFNAYVQAVNNGWMSPNEIRERENLDPYDGGDQLYVPLNLAPAGQAQRGAGDEREVRARAGLSSGQERAISRVGPAQYRSIRGRQRLMRQHRRTFADSFQRIVNKEAKAIRRKLKRELGQRGQTEFLSWLDEFYGDEHKQFVRDAVEAPVQAYKEGITDEVSDEVGEVGDQSRVDSMVDEYLSVLSLRWVEASRQQLRELVEQSEDPAQAVEDRVAEWEQTRADQAAANETVKAGGAIAKAALTAAGAAALRWVTTGAEDCPLCDKLDGTVVDTQSAFVAAGDRVEAEGTGPIEPRTDVTHPPLHQGCDCVISS